ncbi:MAG: T9SS type A sorting domain-containing protein [Bacteroidota bacterium]
MKRPFLFIHILIFLLLANPLIAQQGILASHGRPATTGSHQYHSLGQILFHAYVTVTGSISENVQQAFAFFHPTSIEEADVAISLSAYPNPTSRYLQLIFDAPAKGNAKHLLHLLDSQGRYLYQEPVRQGANLIDLDRFPAATYLVRVYENQRHIRTFKIVKN